MGRGGKGGMKKWKGDRKRKGGEEEGRQRRSIPIKIIRSHAPESLYVYC